MHAMSVDDGYRVERVLARGAGGVTELVTIDGSGPFVRKKIPREQARRTVWAALAECESRYLPKIWATYEMPERFVVVLDFVAGETLESYVKRRGALPEGEARRLIANICEAADDLHAHGVIHRDISPANIIVSSDGAHLIDLGISRMGGTGAAHDTMPLGTFGFAAPEQHGFAETDKRSDVYSIGRVLGYMLTGINPKDEGFEAKIADGETLSAPMRAIVWKACEFDRSARFQSAREMARALRGEAPKGEPFAGEGAGRLAASSAAEESFAQVQGASGLLDAASRSALDQANAPGDAEAVRPSRNPAAIAEAGAGKQADQGRGSLADAVGDSLSDGGAQTPLASDASTSAGAFASSTEESGEARPDGGRVRTWGKAHIAAIVVALLIAALASITGFALVLQGAGLTAFPWNDVSGGANSGAVAHSSGSDASDQASDASGIDVDGAHDANGSAASHGSNPMAGLLGGAVSGEQTEDAAAGEVLSIADLGWYVGADGYVCYAFALRNASSDVKVDYPAVEITGRDEDGSVLFANTQMMNVVLPGETLYYGGLAGNGGSEAPATVEFTPVVPDEWNVGAYDGAANSFSISGLSERDSSGVTFFTGEVTAESIGYSGSGGGTGSLCVSVVLRDESGKIVYGCSNFVAMPAEGESVPFEVTAFGLDVPPHATVEAYAQVW